MPLTTKDKQTHYEILGIPASSTTKEIKSAFLSLSKSHHPDLNPQDPTKHATFVRIMEAYTVLSKPETRSSYDSRLYAASKYSSQGFSNTNGHMDIETNAPRWRDETIWEMRDRDMDKFYEDKPYYGIKGIKRMNNLWIAAGTFGVMCLGAAFHFIALRKSSTFTTSLLDEKDIRLGNQLSIVKRKASENGNDLQIKILEARLSEQD